jgi:hypothetical protein
VRDPVRNRTPLLLLLLFLLPTGLLLLQLVHIQGFEKPLADTKPAKQH